MSVSDSRGRLMLAAVYHGPRDLRVEERPIPTVSPDELLVKIESASLCATDLRILQGNHRKYGPGTIRIIGHELAGTIAELGSRVGNLRLGQRVFIAPNIGCGRCRQCRRGRNNLCPDYQAFGITMDGAFAEYMLVTAAAVQQGNVIPLAAGADVSTAALIEPLACVLHGQEAMNVGEGDVILIQGAGPIGLMHLLLARMHGVRLIILSDKSAERLRKANELGADRTVNFAQEDLAGVIAAETQGEGADVVIVAASAHQAQEQAISVAAVRGRINLFAGLPKQQPTIRLDSNTVHYKELIITGTTGCSTSDCRKAVELVESGRIDLNRLISKRFPLREVAAAFSAAEQGNYLKVVLQPDLNTTAAGGSGYYGEN